MSNENDPFAATALAMTPPAPQTDTPADAQVASGIESRIESGVETRGEARAAREDEPETEAAGPIGRTLNGRYEIKRLLGQGGMGGVYEGEHLEIGKRVAIKLVHSLHARDSHIAARIKQEARSTSAIESEHIVQVFDAGQDESLGLFLVMELLKGEDLANILARRKTLSPSTAAMLVAQAASGLSRAHAAGIVHRDLKPANVFVVTRDDGSSLVKLVDFGIAKLVREANRQSQGPGLTRMGMVIGTPQYMSPEQAQGLPTVDHRTDIYSLGAVLFEAIVGESPFKEMPTYEQTILQIMTRPAPLLSSRIPEIAPELDRLCSEMMAMDPRHRPPTMNHVRERLLALFPEIQNGRAPMRSLAGDSGSHAAADVSSPISGEVHLLIPSAPHSRGAASGLRPATHSAVAVDSTHMRESDRPNDDVSGAPKRRKGGALVVASMLGIAALIGITALVRMRSGHEDKAAGGYGLVQSTVVTTPQAAAPPAVAAPTPPPVAAPIVPTAGPVVPAAPAVALANAKPATEARVPRGAKSAAAAASKKNAAAPAPAKEADAPAARPVGGTGVSTEF